MRTWTRLLLAGCYAVLAAAACGRGVDTGENVERALEQANIANIDVDVDRDANIVHLRGTVGTMADRTRAEELANAAVGTGGRVLSEITVEGLSAATDDRDEEIEERLDRMMDDDAVLKERDITFEVHEGAVAIKGAVRSADEKSRVGQMVAGAAGVKDVANALKIRNPR
jgi:osmotically-inducible protein OsmY